LTHYYERMFELTESGISVCYSNLLPFIQSVTLSGQRNPRASSLSFKFNLLTLPILQRKTSVTIILNAPFCKRCVSNNSALSSSALHLRSARRYAASNDSPFYSTRFLRLGGRAPTRREEALSSSAFHSALRASLHSSE
jgi:hypothetical protein